MTEDKTTEKEKILAIAKNISEKAARNSGAPPQMLFAPILGGLQAAIENGELYVKP